jgi:hypothetical protein
VKFKDWLQKESTVGTGVLHGGIGEAPNQNLNVNMPVRSKISTSDGENSKDSDSKTIKPEILFGFNKRDRIPKDRFSMIADKKDRFPVSTRNVASIGFSG